MDARTAAITTAALADLYAGKSLAGLYDARRRLAGDLARAEKNAANGATNLRYSQHIRTCAALVEQTIAGRTSGV